MAQQRITRTRLDDVRPIGAPGERSYDYLTDTLRTHLGAAHAALFAEPVVTPNGHAVDWMTAQLGTVRPLSTLPEAEAEAFGRSLAAFLSDIRDLADRFERSDDEDQRRRARALRHAMEVPDQSSIYKVGDHPVLVRWAHRFEADGAPNSILSRFMGDGGEPGRVAASIPEDLPDQPVMRSVRFQPTAAGVIVGRQAGPGGVLVDHPSVSKRHARYKLARQGLVVEDLHSETGTFVNGRRIHGETVVEPGDRVDIGTYSMGYDGAEVLAEERAVVSNLSLRHVTREVKAAGRAEPLRILDDVSLDIEPGEFICIIGPSGSGKSTLMNAMSGRVRPSSGRVVFNQLDLHRNFEQLKNVIAMVPQHNLLHETLSLRRALGYTASLRLPPDTGGDERRRIIETAAASVGLSERLDTRIARLSGGQKKRCSLANELLDRPQLLFLDEVTSGLDEQTDREIMALLRAMADQGMTVVCVTHTLANIEAYCDRVIVMGVGGVLTYAGPPAEALPFFGVERLGEVFARLSKKPPGEWRSAFEAQVGAVTEDAAPELAAGRGGGGIRPFKAAWTLVRQAAILSSRNTALLVSDRRIWVMALTQSLLIGALIGYAFTDFGPPGAVVSSKIAMLLLIGLAGLWIGCNTSSKDIVGELKIFQSEHDVNLSVAAFIFAKLLISGSFTILQMSIVYGLAWALAKEVPGAVDLQWGFAVLSAVAGCCLGLLISASTTTTEQATTVVPLVLVPQLILSGVIVPHLPDLALDLSEYLVTSFVLIEGMKSVFIETAGPVMTINADTGEPMAMTARPYSEAAVLLAVHCLVATGLALQITAIRQRLRRQRMG